MPRVGHEDPTDLKAQQAWRDRRARKEKLDAHQADSDLKWLMGEAAGRRIVWRLLVRAGVYQSSFNTNAMTMAFAEGRRNEGLSILASISRLCPERYQQMVEENRERDDGSPNTKHG